jgi:hypothetical protein
MQRRHFLKLGALGVAGMLAADFRLRAGELSSHGEPVPRPDGKAHRFSFGKRQFLLDGQPFQIMSGEMPPIRIPPAYWRHRIRMAKAMGLNTVSLYLMWNAYESEPGVFDMTSGARDSPHKRGAGWWRHQPARSRHALGWRPGWLVLAAARNNSQATPSPAYGEEELLLPRIRKFQSGFVPLPRPELLLFCLSKREVAKRKRHPVGACRASCPASA